MEQALRKFQFGLSTDAVKDDSNANFVVNSTGYSFTNNSSKNKVESINITNQNQSVYFRFKITHGTEIKYNSILIALNSVALY